MRLLMIMFVLITSTALLAPWPETIIKFVFFNPPNNTNSLSFKAKKTASTLAQLKMVNYLNSEIESKAQGNSEAGHILNVLKKVRSLMKTQYEDSFPPINWPSLLLGKGYCDQINGVAGQILSLRFKSTQLIGLRLATGEAHTVGRLFSATENDWLYFDAWAPNLVIFKVAKNGEIVFLRKDAFTPNPEFLPETLILKLYQSVGSGEPYFSPTGSLPSYIRNFLLGKILK